MVSHRIEEVQPEPFHQQPNQRPSPSLKGSEIGEKTRSPGALPAEIKRLIARMAEKPVEKVDHGAETQEVETITPPSSDHVSGEKATSTPDVYEESHVHHTVRAIVTVYVLCANGLADEFPALHGSDGNVIPLGRLTDSVVPVRQRVASNLPGYWWC